METVNILGVHVNKYTMQEAVAKASEMIETDGLSMIFTPNSEIILYASNNPEFTDVINSADMVIPDGIGVVYGAKILKNPIKERVAGYDLVCNLFPIMAEKGQSVYLLGAKPGVAEKAAETLLEKHPGLVIAGTHDGYFKDDEEVIADINKCAPDFLMVCLGFPKQENWIYNNREKLNAKLAIGAGGCLDVFAGTVQRAPEFYCKHGIEWLYRLVKQPSRFVRMLALPKFGLKVLFKGRKYK
ncbi:MAG: WecB/TagA/CpsF family glycosyltransferase [Ruminococcaceae bacterium]|nr:WecB/TagA/CpsF family glycosyltransferase [Oscillospiraceae bacterium]